MSDLSSGQSQHVLAVQSVKESPISKTLAIERDFPHIIEIELPASGLDVRMSREMTTFHRARDIRPRFGRTRTQGDQHYCRWCFSDPVIADAFRARFGGERLTKRL
jgi:hypothetical protein